MEVKLKSFMGMKPGQYLFYLYSAILLVILFFILVFPGLRNNGSEVSFESDPAGTSVWMGDTYVGSTPCTAFVPAGNHTFVFRKTGYEEKAHAAEIGGRIFASALIPAKATVSEKLEMKNQNNCKQVKLCLQNLNQLRNLVIKLIL